MNHFKSLAAFLIIGLSLVMVRCTSGGEDSSKSLGLVPVYVNATPQSNTYSNPSEGYEYYSVTVPEQDAGKNVNFDYNLDLGGDTKDVYFIFTNTSSSGNSLYPTLDSASIDVSQRATPEMADALRAAALSAGKTAQRGKPEISEFNRKPWDFLNRVNPVNMLLNSLTVPEPQGDSVGTTQTFKINTTTSVDATCKKTVYNSNAGKTLSIYVDDNQWTTSGEVNKVNQTMVDALAAKFLTTGSTTNDIYHWVTNIYGPEWGLVSGSSLSPAEQDMMIGVDNQITILLFDIDGDAPTNPSGGVVGYFWAKDNFKNNVVHYSNQRIMFYIDSYFLSKVMPSEGSWDITNKWPSIVISTLAHEFQHMIHFYQKTVMLSGGSGSETWLDEMCAMATEDLVADKLHVDGPRGVDYTDYTAGSTGNQDGRLPLYDLYDDYSVTNWYSGDLVLVSYSLNYALGAYLSRNYGGAQFFRDVVQNPSTDQAAIEYAIQQVPGHSPDETFGQLLQKWAVANLLSDKTNTTTGYMYNSLTPLTDFDSTIGTIVYNLGAIDLFNYTYGSQTGPYIYTSMRSGFMPPASNVYYKAGGGLSGAQTWSIHLNSDVKMSVVVK